jgi:hypothetical protein
MERELHAAGGSGRLLSADLSTVHGRFFSRSPDQAAADVMALLSGDYPAGFYGPGLKSNDPRTLRDDPGLSARLWDYCKELMNRDQLREAGSAEALPAPGSPPGVFRFVLARRRAGRYVDWSWRVRISPDSDDNHPQEQNDGYQRSREVVQHSEGLRLHHP